MADEEKAISTLRNYAECLCNGSITKGAIDIAVTALRERIERNNPQPLTLDELRQMDGEPVWIRHMVPRFTRWYIWDNTPVDDTHDGYEGYGEIWVAYRTKPEQFE